MAQKKGQVTLFIILAVIIVAVVLVFFIYIQPSITTSKSERMYIENCIDKSLQKNIKILTPTAGVIEPEFTTMHKGENITIACYSDEYLKPCVVQIPFFKQTFEDSLEKMMRTDIENCHEDAVRELVLKGYDVQQGDITYQVLIEPENVVVEIKAPVSISSEDGTSSTTTNVRVESPSTLYKVLMIATSILQFEVSYGDSESSSFNFFYSDIIVDKIRASEGMKIYTISDRGDIEFKFASRSYAWPPGYGVN